MSEVSQGVSEDGKSWSAGATIGPRGVYDPELQLGSDQLIAMKELFSDHSFNGPDLQHMVVTEIVTDMLVKDELDKAEEDKNNGKEPWEDEETLELLRNPKVVELIGRAAYLGSHWHWGLSEGISQPGGEWPEYMTPPATFSERLKSAPIAEYVKNLIRSNPETDFAEQISKLKLITGQELDESNRGGDG